MHMARFHNDPGWHHRLVSVSFLGSAAQRHRGLLVYVVGIAAFIVNGGVGRNRV
jgi:hypothetical protein